MKNRTSVSKFVSIVALLSLGACAKAAPPAEDASPKEETPAPVEAEPKSEPLAPIEESSDRSYVEGVAGGVMTSKITLEAEVISVDQTKREAVLRGPKGNEVVVKVGKDAVNFYQVQAGSRVKVAIVRELEIYVAEEGTTEASGSSVAGASAAEGDRPAGVVVASSKVTAKITAIDQKARTGTLKFEDGQEETVNVRPDVDMTKYKVGQQVVFLMTEALALEVTKL